MKSKHVKGTFNEVKGEVKEDLGHAAGNDKLAGEGVVDRAKGKVQNAFGDIKDAVKSGVDKVLNRDDSRRSA